VDPVGDALAQHGGQAGGLTAVALAIWRFFAVEKRITVLEADMKRAQERLTSLESTDKDMAKELRDVDGVAEQRVSEMIREALAPISHRIDDLRALFSDAMALIRSEAPRSTKGRAK